MQGRLFLGVAGLVLGLRRQADGEEMKHREILRNALRQCLAEKWQSFDGITDQIERAGHLVAELGGLQVPEITDLDRAMIGSMIEAQVTMGIERGDFDFVFRHPPAPTPITGAPEYQIARLKLEPGDVVVLKAEQQLSEHNVRMIEQAAERCFPNHRVMVLAEGLELVILGKDAP
jgi:hypothetical protein